MKSSAIMKMTLQDNSLFVKSTMISNSSYSCELLAILAFSAFLAFLAIYKYFN